MKGNIQYTINIDLGAKLDLIGVVNAKVMPLMSQAVRAIAVKTTADWQEAVQRAKLWSGEKDAYANSIKWTMTGDLSAVVEADYKYAADIETGRPARDLKRMLDTSMKVRRTESGKRFLVIPFRHNTTGNNAHARAMPSTVMGLAKDMTPSRVVAMGQRQTGEVVKLSPVYGMSKGRPNANFLTSTTTKQAQMTAQRSYAWGARLTAGMLKHGGLDAAEIKKYAGMVKMDTSTPGGGKSSSYLTFRIMMEGSSGWIVPAKPGLYIAKKVAEQMQPKAQQALQAAAMATIKKG